GVDVTGGDRVGLHVGRAPLGGHGAGEVAQPALGRGVGRDGRPGDLGLDRADVDDLAAAALDHPAGDRAADDEGAGEVHVDDPAPVRELEGGDLDPVLEAPRL